MKIKSATITISLVGMILIILAAAVFVHTHFRLRDGMQLHKSVGAIDSEVAKLSGITSDFLLHKSERTERQWRIKFSDLGIALGELQNLGESSSVFENLSKLYDSIGKIFDSMISPAVNDEVERQLASHLFLKILEIQNVSNRLRRDTNVVLEEANTLLLVSAPVTLAIFSIFVLAGMGFVFVRILRPLKVIETAIKEFSTDLNYKIAKGRDDEFGKVSMAFNRMSHSLANLIATEREAQVALRKLSRTVEQSPSLVIITDTEGSIEYANPKFLEVSGYTLEEVIGQNPRLVKSEDTPPEVFEDLWETIKGGKSWRGELEERRKDGSYFWTAAIISPIRDETGRNTHFVAMYEDITQRKEAEAAMELAIEQAEIANRAKTELLANMSHELRTPLNAIIGFSDAMLKEVFGPLANDKYLDYANDMNNSGTHLLELVNDILDVSAIESGKLRLHEEELDITAVLDASIRLIAHRAGEEKIRLKANYDGNLPKLFADERRIKQIALNLLSNSAKFTEEGGEISVSASMDANGMMEVVFADTGIGMDENEVALALTKFGQVDGSLARKYEGTGLGLPLTQNLVKAHEATFSIESQKGTGTTISIKFPKERVIDQDLVSLRK